MSKQYKAAPAAPILKDELDDVEETVAAVASAKVDSYTVKDGDSYASIAAAFKPAGTTGHAYAGVLFERNRGKTLIPGTIVKL